MRFTRRAATLAAFAATAAVLLVAAPGGAVIGGTSDTANRYANVGVLQLQDEGEWFDFCSGTLVRPDVVLTAAHCTDFLVDFPEDLRISFDPEGDAPYATVDHIVVHPDWFTAGPGRQLEEPLPVASGRGHRARLPRRPGRRHHAGADRGPGLHRGAQSHARDVHRRRVRRAYRFITGSLLANHPVVVVDGIRSYRDVSVITKHDAFPDRFFKITQSVCFGDSGGPMFHEGTVVALNTWTFSTRCSGPNLEYRVDSRAAQSFLEANL